MVLRIVWTGDDGGEHEEEWPSLERFRTWALAERIRCSWSAYELAPDGEWELVAEGRL